MATGKVESDISIVGTLAADIMSKAVVRAVERAETLYERICCRDLRAIMRRADRVFETVIKLCGKQLRERGRVSGLRPGNCQDLNLCRSNVSADLNKLVRSGETGEGEGQANTLQTRWKLAGRDRLLIVVAGRSLSKSDGKADGFDSIIGAHSSLKTAIQQAKAAVLYPPDGLHTLIIGDTGTARACLPKSFMP